jgi:hypothetical protein
VTLSKRALFLIFPVVLLGYLLAALSVYIAQERSIHALEKAKLSQRLEHTAAVFQNEIQRSKSFLNALLNGNVLRHFVAETDERYRITALGVRLQESIKSLSEDPIAYISFAILNSRAEAEYYFENSWDPFAEIDGPQSDLARKLIASKRLSDLTYLEPTGDRPRIVYSLFVDPVTFGRPMPSNKANALLMQIAVLPDRFLAMQAALKKEYGADIALQPWPLAVTDDLSASVPLGPQLYATIAVPDAYFEDQMLRRMVLLAFGALAMSLISIFLIVLLIRRFITEPIASLDADVTAVMNGERDDIRDLNEAGEIGRLTHNIRELHSQSAHSLRLVQQNSWTDTLTGISNRGRFNTLAAVVVEEAIASAEKRSLLFIDIDISNSSMTSTAMTSAMSSSKRWPCELAKPSRTSPAEESRNRRSSPAFPATNSRFWCDRTRATAPFERFPRRSWHCLTAVSKCRARVIPSPQASALPSVRTMRARSRS